MKLGVTKASASSSYNGLGDQLYDLGGARPTLDLNFSSNGSLVDSVTGKTLVDHTRQSSATYVDGDGVIRTAVTNLLLQSEDVSQWTSPLQSGATITSDTATSPIGTTTADTVALTSTGYYYTRISYSTTGNHTASIWLRADSAQSVLLRISNSTGTESEITTCNVTTTWQRFSVSVNYTTNPAQAQVGLDVRTVVGGTGNSATVYVWGAQLEQSSTAGQYVKTTTAINSAPRFDHDPETGESLGLLVEESRTNLLLQSEDFSTTWNTARLRAFGSGSTVNATTAPNGTLTADFIQQASGQTSAGNVNVSTNTATPTVSVYAKASTKSKISILTNTSGNGETWFDLASGTVGTQQSDHTASIVSVGDGWYRCIVSSSATATFVSIYLADTDGSRTVTDSGGVYLWGAQLEAGSFPTSYIPTEGSTVTRAADVASITGTNFSSWYRQDEGTVFAGSISHQMPLSGFKLLYDLSDGTIANERHVGLWNNTNQVYAGTVTAGSGVNTLLTGMPAVLSGEIASMAQSWDSSISVAATRGITSAEANTAGPQSLNQMTLRSRVGGALGFSGTINRLTYWPTRLSNDTLQTITT